VRDAKLLLITLLDVSFGLLILVDLLVWFTPCAGCWVITGILICAIVGDVWYTHLC
jgi:hypothetical protein